MTTVVFVLVSAVKNEIHFFHVVLEGAMELLIDHQ